MGIFYWSKSHGNSKGQDLDLWPSKLKNSYIWLNSDVFYILIPNLMVVAWKLFEWRHSTLHCYKEGKNFNDLWWPWPLRYGHQKKKLYNPGSVFVNWAKNDADPTSGLGEVCGTSNTHKQTGLRYYNIDSIMASTHHLLLQWTTFQNQHLKSTIPQNYS